MPEQDPTAKSQEPSSGTDKSSGKDSSQSPSKRCRKRLPSKTSLALYSELSKPLPSGQGRFQLVVNRLNEILGEQGWGYVQKVIQEKSGKIRGGGAVHEISVVVAIWVRDKENMRTAPGGSVGGIYGDVMAKAFENAFLKAASMFGIGKEFFEAGNPPDNDVRYDIVDDTPGVESQAAMPATKRHAATPKPTSATDAIRKANLAMAEEDGLPPGMRPTTTEAPQPEANVAKMTVEQAKKIRKLSKMAGFDPEEWLKIPRTAEEGKGMLKYLTAKLGPDAMAFANGPSAV